MKCLIQMTESNRNEAQAELKQVISDAHINGTLETTNWEGVQLQRFDGIPVLCVEIHLITTLHTQSSRKAVASNVGPLTVRLSVSPFESALS